MIITNITHVIVVAIAVFIVGCQRWLIFSFITIA